MGADLVPDGQSFLPWFRDRGCWLVDIADVPVNQLSGYGTTSSRRARDRAAAARLGQTTPGRVVAVKRDIEDAVGAAMRLAGVEVPLTTLPFPVRQWRPVYEHGLAELLREGEQDLLNWPGRSPCRSTDGVLPGRTFLPRPTVNEVSKRR